jgi:hypothetical protein
MYIYSLGVVQQHSRQVYIVVVISKHFFYFIYFYFAQKKLFPNIASL